MTATISVAYYAFKTVKKMNRVKVKKNKNYTTISNVFLRDVNLSLKAKGLLATILSLPETWDFSIKGICSVVKEGTTAIYSAIDELKEHGYCGVETNRNEKGMIIGNDYTFYEEPYNVNPHVEKPNVDNQAQINTNINNIDNNNITNNKRNKEEEKEYKEKSDALFEECWITYKRKGSKKQSKYQWEKLNEKEKQLVLPHIKAYTSSREIQYQKDFERYLRDKIFTEIVYNKNNQIVFDPSKINGKNTTMAYLPELSPLLMWNDYYTCYMYLGYWDGHISDGYNDDNRPNGAQITLNNGRGIIKWDANNKKWFLQNEN